MKMLRPLFACLAMLLFAAPTLLGQDFSKYRAFSLGSSLTTVLTYTDLKVEEVKLIGSQPALIQELVWWPPNPPGTPFKPDTVEQIHFSFCNAELYKISVTYDRNSTEGLTAEDMVKSISAKYGPPATVAPTADSAMRERSDARLPIASWGDSQYSVNLARSSFSGAFDLLIYSKRRNAEADLALAAAAKLEKQDAPQREADRQKKEIDDLELTREKNEKSFRP